MVPVKLTPVDENNKAYKGQIFPKGEVLFKY